MRGELSENVFRFRAKYHMTQAEFAKLVGVSVGCIYRIETNQSTSGTTRAKVVMAMEQYKKEGE